MTVGALLAISGVCVAGLVTRPTIGRLVSLGRLVAESGGTPAPEAAGRIGALQRRLVLAERVSFALVLLAVVARHRPGTSESIACRSSGSQLRLDP